MRRVLKLEPWVTSVLLMVIISWFGYMSTYFVRYPMLTVLTSISSLVVYLSWKFHSGIRLRVGFQLALFVSVLCSMVLYIFFRENSALFSLASFFSFLSFLGVSIFFLKGCSGCREE